MPLEVFMGHRVSAAAPASFGPDADYTVSPGALDRFLSERSEQLRPSPDAVFVRRRGERPPIRDQDAFLLTFDDGFVDLRETVLPLLEQHEAPCLLFVVTRFADGVDRPYERSLATLIERNAVLTIPNDDPVPTSNAGQREEAYQRIRLAWKPLRPAERRERLAELAGANGGVPDETRAFLTWEEIRELDAHPLVTIGCHTASHPFLPTLRGSELRDEIQSAREELERRLGHPVRYFSYPYGAQNLRVRWAVRSAGFDAAFTTEPGSLPSAWKFSRFRVPRIDLADVLGS